MTSVKINVVVGGIETVSFKDKKTGEDRSFEKATFMLDGRFFSVGLSRTADTESYKGCSGESCDIVFEVSPDRFGNPVLRYDHVF